MLQFFNFFFNTCIQAKFNRVFSESSVLQLDYLSTILLKFAFAFN